MGSTWTPVCPFNPSFDREDLQVYLREPGTLFVLAWQSLGRGLTTCIREIGTEYVSERDLNSYLKAKNGCVLTQTVEEYTERYAQWVPGYAEEGVRKVVDEEDRKIRMREMRYIPANINEFKASKYFIVPSMMKKYQGLLPGAQPLPDKMFKDE